MTAGDRPLVAALAVLILLHAVMLGALFAGVPPHPPAVTPLFAIAPLVGAAIAAALAALILGPVATMAGRALSLAALLLALVSFGPQKYLDPQFPLIWPAVLCAQAAIVALGAGLARAALARRAC